MHFDEGHQRSSTGSQSRRSQLLPVLLKPGRQHGSRVRRSFEWDRNGANGDPGAPGSSSSDALADVSDAHVKQPGALVSRELINCVLSDASMTGIIVAPLVRAPGFPPPIPAIHLSAGPIV